MATSDLLQASSASAADDAGGVAISLSTVVASVAQATAPSLDAVTAAQNMNNDHIPRSSLPGIFVHFLISCLTVIPTVLFWLITFTSLTLPTWLFTLFSTSLTFTMNFTTL